MDRGIFNFYLRHNMEAAWSCVSEVSQMTNKTHDNGCLEAVSVTGHYPFLALDDCVRNDDNDRQLWPLAANSSPCSGLYNQNLIKLPPPVLETRAVIFKEVDSTIFL